MSTSKHIPSAPSHQHDSHSPRSSRNTPGPGQAPNSGNSNGGLARPPPTGPRAFKKPRLSDSRSSQAEPPHHSLPPNPRTNMTPSLPHPPHRQQQNFSSGNNRTNDSHKSNISHQKPNNRPTKMDVDEDSSSRKVDRDPPQASSSRNIPRDNRGDNEKERRDRNFNDRGSGRDDKAGASQAGNRGPPLRRNGLHPGNPVGRGGHAGGLGRRPNPNERGSHGSAANGHLQSGTLAQRMGL